MMRRKVNKMTDKERADKAVAALGAVRAILEVLTYAAPGMWNPHLQYMKAVAEDSLYEKECE